MTPQPNEEAKAVLVSFLSDHYPGHVVAEAIKSLIAERDRLAHELRVERTDYEIMKADRDRLAGEVERLTRNVVDEQSLGGMKIAYSPSDNRFYAHDADGRFLWSGEATFNVWQCVRLTAELDAAKGENEVLKAQNITLRNAQKACDDCDAPTMEQIRAALAKAITSWKVLSIISATRQVKNTRR